MKLKLLALALVAVGAVSATAEAVVVCYNSACGRIVCNYGCVQQSVNGRCVVNRCTGRRLDANGNVVEENRSNADASEAPSDPTEGLDALE